MFTSWFIHLLPPSFNKELENICNLDLRGTIFRQMQVTNKFNYILKSLRVWQIAKLFSRRQIGD